MTQAGAVSTTNVAITVSDLEVRDGMPRVMDLTLAAALGFEKPHQIRPLIKRHVESLKVFGEVFSMCKKPTALGGRPGKTFYLNEEQAIFITAKSDTARAAEITVEMVRVFRAYLQGQAPSPQRSPDEQDRLYVTEAQTRGFSVTFRPKAAIVHGPGGKSKRLPSGDDIYTRIAATIRGWEMQPPGFLEPGSDLLRDMYILVMNAMLRVEWGDEPNFGKALENVLADRINLRDGTAPSGKRLMDHDWRRIEWPDHFAGAGKPTAAERRGELAPRG